MIKPLKNCYSISSPSDVNLEYLEGNRDPLEHMEHIKKIAIAMRRHKHIPIIMVARYNGHLYIVDGQHRYEAAKLLWENGIEYDLGIEEYVSINPFLEAIEFNTSRLDWTIITFLRAYAINHYANYQEFLDWVSQKDWDRKNSIPYSIGLAFLGVRNREKLKKGEFQIFNNAFDSADRIYNSIQGKDIFSVIIKNEASAKAFYKIFMTDCRKAFDIINNYTEYSITPNTTTIKDWIEFYESFLLVVSDQPNPLLVFSIFFILLRMNRSVIGAGS